MKSRSANDSSRVRGQQPRKRRRVALACSNCRERKVRCDGVKPVCGQCAKREESPEDCVYTMLASSAKSASEQEYIARLQRKVLDLQHAAGDQGSRAYSPNSSDKDRPSTATPRERARSPQDSAGLQHTAINVAQPPARSSISVDEHVVDYFDNSAARPVTSAQRSQHTSRSVDYHFSGVEFSETPRGSRDDHHGPSPISAMGATIPSQDEQSSGGAANEFYGESSLVSLVREVANPVLGRQGVIRDARCGPNTSRSGGSRSDDSWTMLQSQFSLPPRVIADKLFDLYYSSVHIFYPWTHSVSFRKTYERLWTDGASIHTPSDEDSPDIGLGGRNVPRSVFFSALNAIFALGCEFSEFPLGEKESASAMFFDRMSQLLRFDILDSGSIAHIQALLLASRYMLCTHYPTRCWNVVGLACRMALGLGLHSPHFSGSSGLEREMRRRVWYACIQMDMTVSMTLGRPPSLHVLEDVPLPLAVDDQYWTMNSESAHQPPGTFSAHLFNIENIKSAKLLGAILKRMYHQPSKDKINGHNDLGPLLSVDSELNTLSNSCPDVIHWDRQENTGVEIPQLLRRQSNVLHARFLHMKILLYRPSFTEFCTSAYSRTQRNGEQLKSAHNLGQRYDDDLGGPLRTQCAVACVKRTWELVKSLQRANLTQATGAWWFSLFYLLTSAFILIIAECTQSLKALLDDGMLDSAWQSLLDTLGILSHNHILAGRYFKSLKVLRERSLSSVNGRHPSAANVSTGPSRHPNNSPRESPSVTHLDQSDYDVDVIRASSIAGGGDNDPGAGLQDMNRLSSQPGTRPDWQFSENNDYCDNEFDFSVLLGTTDTDIESLLNPMLDVGALGYGYPATGLL